MLEACMIFVILVIIIIENHREISCDNYFQIKLSFNYDYMTEKSLD